MVGARHYNVSVRDLGLVYGERPFGDTALVGVAALLFYEDGVDLYARGGLGADRAGALFGSLQEVALPAG